MANSENPIREFIAKTRWEYLVNRPETILFKSITDQSSEAFFRLTGLSWRPSAILRFSHGELYLVGGEAAAFARTLEQSGFQRLVHFRRQLVKHVSALDRMGVRLAKLRIDSISDNKIFLLTRRFVETSSKAQGFLIPTPIAGTALERLIKRGFRQGTELERTAWLHQLMYPAKDNVHIFEERAFLRLLLAIRRRPKLRRRLIEAHLRTYGWIGARWFHWENSWNLLTFTRRIANWKEKSSQDIQKVIAERQVTSTQHRQTVRALAKELRITPSSPIGKTVRLAREFTYLRTWRTDTIYHASFRSRHLFQAVATRLGLSLDELCQLTRHELFRFMSTRQLPVSRAILRDRKKFHMTLYRQGKYSVLTKSPWIETVAKQLRTARLGIEVKGTSAFSGRVFGTVKVVRSVKDLNKVRRGDVLVAVMTFPHFIAAMERAAAFVTDEGGILCHAAIISREMKKPCIIGTKTATSLLKDGDFIEVDAVKGIVRKIRNS